MADKIRISTTELNAQAAKLSKLHGQINDIYHKADKALNLMNDALSAKFVLTMLLKKITLLAKIAALRKSLNDGANVAIQCAITYENADKVLRDLMGNSLPTDIINCPVSNQQVTNSGEAYRNKIVDIIAQEKSNLSNCTAQKYWSWYYGKDSSRSDGWCAVFASYMMEKSGIDVNSPTAESEWFKTSPEYQFNYLNSKGFIEQKTSGYSPQVGDLVFYDGGGGSVGHVAVVSSVENGVITTLHGNVGFSTIYEMPEDHYRNGGGYCKILGYGNISALAASQTN